MKRVNRLRPLTAVTPEYSLRLVHVIGIRIHHCVGFESFKSLLKVAERVNEVFAQEVGVNGGSRGTSLRQTSSISALPAPRDQS